MKEKDIQKIHKLLKKGIWLYFFLLIFEGALRKWFLPFLSAPLLIVRDPLVIWLLYKSWKHNMLPSNFYTLIMIFLGLLGICTALFFGHGNLFVAIFGARILAIHFPFMFVIGAIFKKEDVIKLGKVVLWIAVPMTVLIGLQYFSPQSAWVNRGIGGDVAGGGFSGAMGYFRPPGTFSFTSGNVMFFSLAACFIFYFWLVKEKVNSRLLIGATIAIVAAIPLSLSRSLIVTVIIIFLFALLAVASKPKFLGRMIIFMVLGVLVLGILAQTPFFETTTGVLTQRFENASNSEGSMSDSIANRILGGMLSAISGDEQLPFFGFGMGMGTNVGSSLLTGERGFLISEGEWGRLIGEMGFVMGMMAILVRVSFSFNLFINSYKNMRVDNLLPWLLFSVGFFYIILGQWAQPTALGFSTLLGGLILAVSKRSNLKMLEKKDI